MSDRRRRTYAEIRDDVLATKLFGRLWIAGYRTADVLAMDDAAWASWVRERSVPTRVRDKVIDEMAYAERERMRMA